MALLELVNYRAWTELLGPDREWRLQAEQASVYREAQLAAARVGAMAVPLRYDYIAVLASNVGPEELSSVAEAVRSVAPVEVRWASGCGPTPADAVRRAFESLRGRPAADPCGAEISIVGQVDLNDVTGLTERTDPLRAFEAVQEVLAAVRATVAPRGGVAEYLGGDNILVVYPVEGFEDLARRVSLVSNVKVGVGVARRPRAASELATRALDEIRSRRAEPVRILLEDGVAELLRSQ